MPRISVVVPIYDVEAYLAECLRSLAAQTVRDLEVVMVDDGSTDGSRAIAERFAERDPRFRVIAQRNHGLGHARNTGVAAATGELLAFADSDDVIPCEAYERLAGALDMTGSDFATGNVLRLEDGRTTQAPFLAKTFARTRLKTHVTRFAPLLADRTAWNKLFRREFWDRAGLAFPVGVLHEDIPVMLPAHVRAGSVDVLSDPVYQWRIRGDGASITQKRQEMRALVDRLAAIEHVRADLAAHAPRKVRRWYDERLVRDDLRLHLNVLAGADASYRARFMARVTPMLEGVRPRVLAELPAIDRLKWHLVREGRAEELVEVLRFCEERRASTPPLRRWGRWYGDYPFRGDRELRVPRSVYRLGKADRELSLRATVEELSCERDRLVVRGRAHIAGLAVAAPGDQRVQVLAVRAGRFERLRMRTTMVRAQARPVERPELGEAALDLRWAGFEAALPTAGLRGTGTWRLCLYVRAHGLRRRYQRFRFDDVMAAELPAAPGLAARAVPCPTGRVELHVRDRWARAEAARVVQGDVLELSGGLRLAAAERLEARRAGDGWATDGAARRRRRSVRGAAAAVGPLRRAARRRGRRGRLGARGARRRPPRPARAARAVARAALVVLGPRARARAHARGRERDRRARRPALHRRRRAGATTPSSSTSGSRPGWPSASSCCWTGTAGASTRSRSRPARRRARCVRSCPSPICC